MIWLIGILTATIIILSVSGFLLRRKEREPSEAARSGNVEAVDRDGDGPLDEGDEERQERRAAAGRAGASPTG
jgi:hypothetical protein